MLPRLAICLVSLLIIAAYCTALNAQPLDAVDDLFGEPEPRVSGAMPSGLKWLATQQGKDGRWEFQPELGAVPMNVSATYATGLVLVSYLGAGQNHKEGSYKQTVRNGLAFLLRRMKFERGRGDLRDGGDMVAHGVAALALCEAYAVTQDKELLKPARQAIAFIEHTQNDTGGWGSQPNRPDDMHVLGWQLLALRSAHMAYLPVSKESISRLSKYLDGQTASGTHYGRYKRGRDAQATAIGLLGRTMLGWKGEIKVLQEGREWIARSGPTPHDLERNFFTHQLMFQAQGQLWNDWNTKIRDQIAKRQEQDGEHRGSWHDDDDDKAKALGRVHQTALNLMMLEVYYRHLGIYDTVQPEKPKSPEPADDPSR